MSSFLCLCGQTIRDKSDCLPYKGEILPDIYKNGFFDSIVELSEDERTDDFAHSRFLDFARDIYQCEDCGVIWIEKNRKLYPFSPVDHDERCLLDKVIKS